jgi:hypothetical protein
MLALEILAPFVGRHAQAFQNRARSMADRVRRYSEAAGQLRDNALLARVARALGEDAAEEDPASEALKAKIDAIVDAARKTGALDEGALAELSSELAGRVRATWAAAQMGSGGEKTGA